MAEHSTTDLIDTGSAAAELVAAEIVDSLIIDAAYAGSVMLPLVYIKDMRGMNTLTSEHVKWPKLAATSPGDGADFSNTAVNTTSLSVTIDESGLMVAVSDLMLASGAADLGDYGRQIGRALAEYIDTDLTAEFADFTSSVGSSGQNMTVTNWLDAIYTNENANNLVYGDLVAVLHPIQVSDLRNDVEANTGTIFGTGTANSIFTPGVQGQQLFGVPIYSSTTCAAANTNADRVGAMWPRGTAIVFDMLWEPRTELSRDASLRSTEIVVVSAYGHQNVNVAGGVKIVTDL